MDRITHALLEVAGGMSGADLAQVLDIPKRTADRWLGELRQGSLDNWHGGAIARLAAFESATWGTCRIADALRPEQPRTTAECADATRVATVMQTIIASHIVNSELLGQMAADLSDGVLEDHEVRRMLPLVERALLAATAKHRTLVRLKAMLEERLRRPAGRSAGR